MFGGDLLTGVFVLLPLAYFARRPAASPRKIARVWLLVFVGNLAGAITVALFTSVFFTTGFSTPPNEIGRKIASIGESRTIGYKEHGFAGMLTVFCRAILCNWMVSLAVLGSMITTSVSGRVIVMWMPIMLFFAMGFEHSIVNMYLFPTGLMLNGSFSVWDYVIWNELPVLLGNLLGGLLLTVAPLHFAYGARATNYQNLDSTNA